MKQNSIWEMIRAKVSRNPVTTSLLLPLSVLVVLLLGGATGLLFRAYDAKLREVSLAFEQVTMGDLDGHLIKQTRALEAFQDLLLANSEVKYALKTGDRERLLDLSSSVFSQLKARFAVTHLNYLTPDRTLLLRVHQPELNGDRIDRFTMLEAERTGEPASGIEFGAVGTLVLRVVRPLFDQGQLIGYMEIGKEIQDVLESLVAFDDVEKILAVRKSHLDRDRWEAGMAEIGREGDWERLPDHAIIYSSMPLPEEVGHFIGCDAHEHWDAADEVRFDGKHWRVMVKPVLDAADTEIGDLMLLHDVTRLKRAQRRQMLAAALLAGMLLPMLVGVIVVMLYRTDRDIRAQQADLREERERIAHILAITGTGIDIIDEQFNLVFVDEAWQRVYGDPTGRKCYEYFMNKGVPCPACGVSEALETKQVVITEKCLPKENKKIVEVHTVPFEDATGRWLAAEFKMDITERKRAETRLRELNMAVEQSGDGIALADMDGHIRFVNRAWADMHGYAVEELIGQHLGLFHTPEQLEKDVIPFNERLVATGAHTGEVGHKHKDGSTFLAHMVTSVVKDATGTPFGLLAIARDITESCRQREREMFDNRFHSALADASARFVEVGTTASFDEAVNEVLATVGQLFGGDRAYLLRFSEDISTMDNTHEWCAPGIEPQIERVQQVPTSSMPWWLARMRELRPVHIPDVSALPAEAVAEKEEFQSQDIQSLVCLPICDGRKNLLGFVGLDAVREPHIWSGEQISMLQVFAEIIGNAMVRMEAVRALVESEAKVRRKLEVILEPEGDIEDLDLTDILDAEALQAMMEDFHAVTNIGSAVVDMSGKVLVAVGWQDICLKYHRVHPETLKSCQESDVILSSGIAIGEFKAYRCKNGMWDMATPIVVGGRQMGNMFLGQFFHEEEKPDVEAFRRQARQYGFPEEEYLAALERVPRWRRETVEAVMAFYAKLAGMISAQGYGMIQLARTLAQKEKALAEQQRAEDQLREREEKFRSMFESMTEIVVIHELVFDKHQKPVDYRIIDCNPAFTKSTGIPFEDAVGRLATEVYQTDHAPYLEEYARVALTGEPHAFTTYYPPLDKHFEINVASPKRSVFFTVSADITKRKQAEAALIKAKALAEENETRFRALHNASFGGITIHDKGIILDCNQGLSEITGYSVEELIGMNGLLLISEKTRDLVIHNINARYEKPYEAIGVRKNGEEYPIRLEAREIPYKGKQVRVVEFRDITEQKQAEEELRRLRNYLANIIDSMPSLAVGVDCEGKVTQWNAKACEATGITPEEAQGRPLSYLLPRFADQMDKICEAMRERQAKTELRRIRSDGEGVRYEDVTIYPLVANGVEGAVIRVDDVTERVRIEEMMVQSEKMLSVGGLAAGMAHEINNPLAGMMQTAQVLLDRLTGDLPANEQAAREAGTEMSTIRAYMASRGLPRMVKSISETGARAAKIVTNMLSFARKSDMAFSGCDMAELLDQTLELAASDYDLKKQYDFRQIEIVRDYEEGVPCVPCEAAKIQQVLLNLLRNGAEAMQQEKADGGKKKDATSRFILRVAYEKAARKVRVEIEDNGPGLDESGRRRMFEPFFTTKPVGQGTGLGLSVSYFIITEIHKGGLTVESEPGQGAKFIIRLPLRGE